MKLVPRIRTMAPRALVGALAVSAAAAQDRVELFLDTSGPGGVLLALVESSGAAAPPAAKLRGLELLPVDFHGRTQLDALLPDRARFLDDVPGASRVVLPGIGGVLYRHSRVLSGGSRAFGFLRVAPDGGLGLVAERPGTGPAGDGDPWLGRVAIDADGRRVLAGTRPAAGGDVLELDLVDGSVIDRSPHVPALPWIEGGLALGEGFGVAISTRGVFRFERQPGAVIQRVPMGQPAPTWYSGEVVFSPNREWAITTAGAGETQAHAFAFSRTSPSLRVTTQPAELSGAGFLPDALDGPFLAIADDGGVASWRARVFDPVEMKTTREAFMGRVGAPPSEEPAHVTGDAFFTDTLDEVGVLTAIQVGKMLMAVGGRNTEVGEFPLENADFYEVTLDASGEPQLVNITRTSGDLVPPFEPGEIAPVVVHELPEAGGLLVWNEQSGGTGELILVDPDQTGYQTVLPDVKELDFAVGMGDDLALSLQRRFASNDPHQVLRVPRDLSTAPVVLDEVLLGVQHLYPVTTDDGWLAFLARPEFGPEMVQRLRVSSGGGLETFPLGGGSYGDVLGLSPGGALLLSRTNGAGDASFFAWRFDGTPPYQLTAPVAPGHVVPGR